MLRRTLSSRVARTTGLAAIMRQEKELSALEELMSAEKTVHQLLEKLAAGLKKASECLKAWGEVGDEDIRDTATACSTLSLSLSGTVAVFASRQYAILNEMKSVKSSMADVDGSYKVLTDLTTQKTKKITAVNKSTKKLVSSSRLSVALDDDDPLMLELAEVQKEIVAKEANLANRKRSAMKTWLSGQYGGIEELSEKGTIIGQFGKAVAAEIPTQTVPANQRRETYTGYPRVQSLIVEAQLAIHGIEFSLDVKPDIRGTSLHRRLTSTSSRPTSAVDDLGGESLQRRPRANDSTPQQRQTATLNRRSLSLVSGLTPPGSEFVQEWRTGLPTVHEQQNRAPLVNFDVGGDTIPTESTTTLATTVTSTQDYTSPPTYATYD